MKIRELFFQSLNNFHTKQLLCSTECLDTWRTNSTLTILPVPILNLGEVCWWTRMNKQRHFACYWLTTRTGSYFYTCTQLLTDLYARRNSLVLREKQNSDRRFKLHLIDCKKFHLFNIHMIKNFNSLGS